MDTSHLLLSLLSTLPLSLPISNKSALYFLSSLILLFFIYVLGFSYKRTQAKFNFLFLIYELNIMVFISLHFPANDNFFKKIKLISVSMHL